MRSFVYRWAIRLAVAIPFAHIILHLLGVPHPEALSFIP